MIVPCTATAKGGKSKSREVQLQRRHSIGGNKWTIHNMHMFIACVESSDEMSAPGLGALSAWFAWHGATEGCGVNLAEHMTPPGHGEGTGGTSALLESERS